MKKMIHILSIITLATFLNGCIFFSLDESDTLSYKIKSSLKNKFVAEEYTDNLKNKQGNLIKIKFTVNLNGSSNNTRTDYDISAIYDNNDDAYINKTLFYRIKHIPINNGVENNIYLPIIKGYKMSLVSIDHSSVTLYGTFLTDYNRDGNLKPAVNGQTIKFKSTNEHIKADILLCFDPIFLYIKSNDIPPQQGGTHS